MHILIQSSCLELLSHAFHNCCTCVIAFFWTNRHIFRLANGCFSRKFLKKSGQIPEIAGKGETFRKFTEWKICKKENALLELKKISSLLNNEHSNICKKV